MVKWILFIVLIGFMAALVYHTRDVRSKVEDNKPEEKKCIEEDAAPFLTRFTVKTSPKLGKGMACTLKNGTEGYRFPMRISNSLYPFGIPSKMIIETSKNVVDISGRTSEISLSGGWAEINMRYPPLLYESDAELKNSYWYLQYLNSDGIYDLRIFATSDKISVKLLTAVE